MRVPDRLSRLNALIDDLERAPQSVDRDALLRMAKSRAAALHAAEGRPSGWGHRAGVRTQSEAADALLRRELH
jgi:hypothetical protein